FASFRQGYLAFKPAALQVDAKGNESQTLLGRAANQSPDLAVMEQKLACAERIVIGVVPVRVRANVTVQQPNFAALYHTVVILEIHPSFPGRFDFGSGQHYSSLKFLENVIVVKFEAGIVLTRTEIKAAREGRVN